ncbi:MAG: glycosyltransferase family 4 protein [Chitinophagales bacterium]|nr:glycosyltransferase family 4 protein [Chitinophagales bacterium]GIK23442.1 MAG: glycosyl transferase [Ignavibacteriota bacterium]
MKVLFLLNGLTHYVIPVLNKINQLENVEVIAISAGQHSSNVGSGVYLSENGINFKVYFDNEIERIYRKTFFQNFKIILDNEQPNIIVLGWPFVLELVFNPFLTFHIKKNKIKILFKEIPFQVQPFYDAIKFKSTEFINENLELIDESFKRKISNFFIAIIRSVYYRIADGIITYTEDSYKLLKTFGVSKEKIFVSYNSPDTELLKAVKNQALSSEPILAYNYQRLIHVGRLVKWKRVDFLLKAIKDLENKFPQIELIIIGNGPENEKLKLFTEELGVRDRVMFLGAIYDSVLLAKYFLSSGVYVLGGMGGLSINEAMIFGKPVICSICDGTERKLVQNGRNGLIFINGDYEDFKNKLSLLLSDEDKIRKFGRQSEKIIENEVNIYNVLNGYKRAFDYLMKYL